jgi:hypothetical protein
MLKKVIIGLQVVILGIVGFLLYAHFDKPDEVKPYVFNEKGKAISKLSSDDIIVYYNSDTLREKSVYIQTYIKRLENNGKYAEESLGKREAALMKKAEMNDRKYQSGQMTQVEYNNWLEEGNAEKNKLDEDKYRTQESFDKTTLEYGKKMHDAILHCMKELSKGKKIKFILSYSESSQLVMPMEGAVDLTADMVSIMNDLYKAPK